MKTNLSLKDELLSAIRRIVAKFWAQVVGQSMRLQSAGYHANLSTKIGIRSRIVSRMLLSTLLMLTVCIGNVWGASFAPSNFSGQGTSGTGSAISATVDGVTFACDKGYGTTQIRCYSGGKITISSSSTITAISFTFSSNSNTGGMSASYTGLSTTSWTFTLTSQARITGCSVTVSAATKIFTLAVPTGAGGAYNTSKTGQQKSALTEANAISAVSCGNGLNGTYANMWTSTAIGTPTNTYPSNVVTSSTADGDLPASGTTLYAVFTTNDEGKYTTNPVCNPACTNGTVIYAKGSTTYTGGNAISGSHANSTKVCSTNLTLPGEVFTTTGYTQDGWATSDGGSKAYNLSATNYATEGDATLYPHWTANKYTVSWSVNGSVTSTTPNVSYNTTTSTPANPSVPSECTGSTFMGWTSNSSWASDSAPGDLFNGTTPAITGNVTFYAVFADEE